MRGLTDKRVLVTGGASGIGLATVKRFLDEGSRVVILDHDSAACDNARSDLPNLSANLLADVSATMPLKRRSKISMKYSKV